MVCASSVEGGGWRRWVRREGELAHPNRCPVWNAHILYVTGEEAVEGSDYCLERPRTRLGMFKNLKKNIELGKGEQWDGRSRAERRESEPTQTDTRLENLTPGKNHSNSECGSGRMWWRVGKEGGTSPSKPVPGSKRSHLERK